VIVTVAPGVRVPDPKLCAYPPTVSSLATLAIRMPNVVCVSCWLIMNDADIVIVSPGATVDELAVTGPGVIRAVGPGRMLKVSALLSRNS
jgi:hypothetical protein